jgi:hypothetical protein
VVDLVGDVPLAEKALADLGVEGKAGVEHLDGGPPAVAVRGLVDGAHAADVDQPIDLPLGVENLSHPRLGGKLQRVDVGSHPLRIRGRTRDVKRLRELSPEMRAE